MSFGWSAGDLVAALQLLNTIRIALSDTGGAVGHYREQVAFLQQLGLTLGHLDALHGLPVSSATRADLQAHCEKVRGPLLAFLGDGQRRFRGALGRRTAWADLRSAPRKVQWPLWTAERVRELREGIAGSLDAIQIVLCQESL